MGSEVPIDPGHEPVLLREVMTALAPRPGETFVDATVGRGGHAEAILRQVLPGGRLLGLDRDAENLAFSAVRLAGLIGAEVPPIEPRNVSSPAAGPLRLVHADFARLGEVLAARNLAADGILADLGIASTHVDDPTRGFSFRGDGPLDMRLDRGQGPTAAELLASLSETEIARAIRVLGEEPLASAIARKIARVREATPISTTSQLAALVRDAYGSRAGRSRMHPATRTFMALRIAVNDELGSLRSLLASISDAAASLAAGRASWLRPGGRLAVISFHSLEDRMVKHAFADLAARGLATLPFRRPVEAGEEEIARNPRSRSAKLRVAMVGGAPLQVP